jgi:hypothetical protein
MQRRTAWRIALVTRIAAPTIPCGRGISPRTGGPKPFVVPTLETLEVGRGDNLFVVTEKGDVESSLDDVIRCGVE